jgi:hypothetical protein
MVFNLTNNMYYIRTSGLDPRWKPVGGACYVSYDNLCVVSGFKEMGVLGEWGKCNCASGPPSYFCPPGAGCGSCTKQKIGTARLCCEG